MGHLQCSRDQIRSFTTATLLALPFAFVSFAYANAYNFKKLYTFCQPQICPDGFGATGLLVNSNGVLNGTGDLGGKYGGGVVFALTPNAGQYDYSVIHNFCKVTNCPDGAEPIGDLTTDTDGNFYGTTVSGGHMNSGLVFSLTHSGNQWTYQVLYSFCAQSSCSDGGRPGVGLSYQGQASGAAWNKTSPLFGTNTTGGAHDNGVVFKLTRSGSQWHYAVIHNVITGVAPNAPLVDSSGNLFATDNSGGKYNGGVLYRLAKSTWQEVTIHNFCAEANCADGANPVGKLALDSNGNVFGVAESGGMNNGGVVFERPASGGYDVIYKFCPQASCLDGARPTSLTLSSNTKFFGTSEDGGANAKGVAFSLARKNGNWNESVIHDFCGKSQCTDGAIPYSPMIEDASGNLFGSTLYGGSTGDCLGGNDGCGIVFELKP